MSWLELSIDATYEAVDWVRTLLSATDYVSDIEIVSQSNQSNLLTQVDESQTFTIRFYLAYDFQANSRLEKIENLLSPLHRTGLASTLHTNIVNEKSINSELSISLVHQIGQRFVVVPPDADYHSNRADEIIIRLERSLSFGSGLHPATFLCLQLLEQYVTSDMNVLDLGSGSGILSVAIAKLGATVLAIDNDKVAVQATQNAVVQNGVEPQVTVMEGSLGQGSQMGHWMGLESIDHVPTIEPSAAFDLIVANILGRMHIALASDYHQALQRSGTRLLITSGYTTDYENEINSAFTEAGFEAIDSKRFNEWVALAHRLKA
jgi:ribosomal protein L11 methyltransferase